MEEILTQLKQAEQAMEKAYQRTQTSFNKIQAGRALPSMLDGILVVYYDNAIPIHQVASISAPDAKTLVIKPWEKRLIPELEKAIFHSHLALTPQNDGEVVRLNIPPLTEERRKDFVKQVKGEAEKGRVMMRNIRKDIKEALKKLQKAGSAEDEIKKAETQVQQLTDAFIDKIDTLLAQKEAALMAV